MNGLAKQARPARQLRYGTCSQKALRGVAFPSCRGSLLARQLKCRAAQPYPGGSPHRSNPTTSPSTQPDPTTTSSSSTSTSSLPPPLALLGLTSLGLTGAASTPSTTSPDATLSSTSSGRSGSAAAALPTSAVVLLPQLAQSLQRAANGFSKSLEQLVLDGAAEGMAGWDARTACTTLMALAAVRRCPDVDWLNEYWAATLPKLQHCTAGDLAMLSYAVSQLQLQPPYAWVQGLLDAVLRAARADDAAAASSEPVRQGSAADVPVRQINSAYDMEDMYVVESEYRESRSSSGIAGVLLAPLQGAWRGVRGAAAAAAAGWRRGQAGGELVTAVHNLAAAGVRVEAAWLAAFAEAMAPRLSDLSGDDLQCLLECLGAMEGRAAAAHTPTSTATAAAAAPASTVAAAAAPGSTASAMEVTAVAAGSPAAAAEAADAAAAAAAAADALAPPPLLSSSSVVLSPGWLARLYARVDGINWALQGDRLVGILNSLAQLGARPPPPWVRRQLVALQPALHLLADDSLVDLAALLHTLPLIHTTANTHVPASAASGAQEDSSLATPAHTTTSEPTADGAVGSALPQPPAWLDGWMADYAAALGQRCGGLEAADLLQVIIGCDRLTVAISPELSRRLREAAAAAAAQPGTPTDATPTGGGKGRGAVASVAAAVAAAAAPTLRFVPFSFSAFSPTLPPNPPSSSPALDYASVSDATAPSSPPATASTPAAAVAAGLPSAAPKPTGRAASPPGTWWASSYGPWRRTLVAAVAARLPYSDLVGLCEAWQALADAEEEECGGADEHCWVEEGGEGPPAGSTGGGLAALRKMVADSIASPRHRLSTCEVSPVLSSLAAAGRPLPPATLDALLAGAQPLLPGLTSTELVTLATSLVRLSYRPNTGWQASYFAATRRRLSLMSMPQRASLLIAVASLGMHLPDPWLADFFAVSERPLTEPDCVDRALTGAIASGGEGVEGQAEGEERAAGGSGGVLDGQQLAHLLWAVSCVVSEPPATWLDAWERASLPRLRELGPNMLAVVLKAMSTLHYRPSRAWQSAFFAALQRRLFAAGAARLPSFATTTATSDPTSLGDDDECVVAVDMDSVSGDAAGSGRPTATAAPASASPLTSTHVTPESLNSLVYSLASLDLAPPPGWLDELMDAVRCQLSLLSTLDLSVVLAYLVARKHRPHDEWWESFLEALRERFSSLSAGEMASLLIMLNALQVSPPACWLDAFCSATLPRLGFFAPSHLLQVLSCLHLFRHRPSQTWMAAYVAAVEQRMMLFRPIELARVLMLLDHLNQRPSAAFMGRFFEASRPGLSQLEAGELANVAWAAASCSSTQPDVRWVEAVAEAARPRVPSLPPPQLRVLAAAVGQLRRGAAPGSSPAVDGFLALAQEFLLV